MTALTMEKLLNAMELVAPRDDDPVGAIVSPLIMTTLRQEVVNAGQERFNSHLMGLPFRELPELLPDEWACYNHKGDILRYSGRWHVLSVLVKIIARKI